MHIPTARSHHANGQLRVGLLSDTHNLLRPEVEAWLQGSDHIIHAGDIGNAEILARLERIAPVTAVRGNNDTAPWTAGLGETEVVRIAGIGLYVIHNVAELGFAQVPAEVRVILFGHSHKPIVEQRNGLLYVNPGSAGPRRFKLPITAAELFIEHDEVDVRIHHFS